jgi:hypothetical protein
MFDTVASYAAAFLTLPEGMKRNPTRRTAGDTASATDAAG